MTASESTVHPHTLLHDTFISTTLSSADYNAYTVVTDTFMSSTKSSSTFDSWVRSYKHDPLAYQQSESIFIYDRDERLQLILSDNTIPYQNGWYTEQLNGEETLEFEVIADHVDADLIEEDGRAVIRNIEGEFVEFIIRVVEDIDDSSGTFKSVQAEGGEYELIDEWITQYKASNVTLRTALGAVLSGTRWQIGVVDDFGTQSVDLRNMSVKAGIYELLNIFGGERKTRVEVVGNRVTRRYLDVLENRGVDTGKRFEAGKDIISSNRVIDSSGIKTALYGFGASRENNQPRITFADVEWKKANGDPIDKPLGQSWVGDPDALQKYGYEQGNRHRFGSYDGQEEDPAELLFNTWKELQALNHINETYDFNVIQLQEILGYAHEKVRLGDRTFAININVFPKIEVENSIIEYRQNLNDRKLSEVILGNFRRTYDLSNRFNRVEKDVNEKQGNWDSKPDLEDVEDIAEAELQKALDEAQERIDQAKEELEQALVDLEDSLDTIEIGKDRIIGLEGELDDLDYAISNKIPYGMAAQDVNSSNTQILGKNLVVDGNTTVTGTIGASNAIFQNLGTIYMTAIDSTIQSATITGTLNSNNAIFQKGTFREADIIDANIQNAAITGRLDGVDGNFVGTVLANQIIGNEISGVTLRTANSTNYLHMQRQNLDFWNGGLRKMRIGFISDWGNDPATPLVYMGAGDGNGRNVVVINKLDNRFNIHYKTSGSGGSLFEMTNSGNVSLSAKSNLDLSGNVRINGSSVSLVGHTHSYNSLTGKPSVTFDVSSSGNLAVYDNGVYRGFIPIQ